MEVDCEEMNLYVAAVELLREHGVSDASWQIICEVRGEPNTHEFVMAATHAARPVLAPMLEEELERPFDVRETKWILSPREAHKVIDRWAVL